MQYITHFILPEPLPSEGMLQLFFFSQDSPSDHFWGTDKQPYSHNEIRTLVAQEKAVRLTYKVFLPSRQTFWIDHKGILWLADRYDSSKNKEEIGAWDVALRQVFQEMGGSV